MNWFQWILAAIGSLVVIVGFAFIVLILLTAWYNEEFCQDDE